MATEILRPNDIGDYTALSHWPDTGEENWEDVDDVIPDEDTTYVFSGSLTQEKDAYNLEPSSIPGGSVINSVKVYYRWVAFSSKYGEYAQPYLRLSGVETAGSEEYTISTDWQTLNEILSRPGGGNWSVADLADLQVVIGLRTNDYHESIPRSLCTQTYVEVDWSEGVGGLENKSANMAAKMMAAGLI